MRQLLKGIRVLDLTRLYPGPFCTMMMAELGAEVIKVESPGEGDYLRAIGPADRDGSISFRLLNQNKKSITLNLKSAEGVELFMRLAKDADVVVEGFRPGVVTALGIDYAPIKAVNPEIIYCSITGYGQDGPYRDRAGHDLNYLALSGILGMTGLPDGQPVIPSVQIGDVGGGALMALSGILAALYGRANGQGGSYLDVAMLDGLISWLPLTAADHFAGLPARRGSSLLNGGYACYHVYQTADDGYMALGALEVKFWVSFCRAVGREDLLARQYESNQEALKNELKNIFLQHDRQFWQEIFSAHDCCCEPVLSLAEAFTNPQVLARKAVVNNSLSFPLKITPQEESLAQPAPRLGEHTAEICSALGYSQAELEELWKKGVI
ncbi:MAG: CoA transferase [Dethiobacter sp.]|nr:CoA transferase [Dethiobacter sp.]MBS3898777.1 CoA transferase [Dethiobacter sp.]